jgi:hypothetical protein
MTCRSDAVRDRDLRARRADHPDISRGTLIVYEVGELDRARQLQEDVLAGFRRLLGDDHPDTLRAPEQPGSNLAGE